MTARQRFSRPRSSVSSSASVRSGVSSQVTTGIWRPSGALWLNMFWLSGGHQSRPLVLLGQAWGWDLSQSRERSGNWGMLQWLSSLLPAILQSIADTDTHLVLEIFHSLLKTVPFLEIVRPVLGWGAEDVGDAAPRNKVRKSLVLRTAGPGLTPNCWREPRRGRGRDEPQLGTLFSQSWAVRSETLVGYYLALPPPPPPPPRGPHRAWIFSFQLRSSSLWDCE